jgi:transcriptional regulator EpsA
MLILASKEQEYLLHALESAMTLRDARQFFLWSQGALQALLPHRVLLCLQLDGQGVLRHLECVHSTVLDDGTRRRLCDPAAGLMLALLRCCQATAQPLVLGAAPALAGGAALQAELAELGLPHALAHGTGAVAGGASYFFLLGMPRRPDERHAYFLQLLLPQLHLALQRLAGGAAAAPALAMSPRQAQILQWLGDGKSNQEIGQILGISEWTVKNHLQRLYKLLGVSNRAHAVARCGALGTKYD